MKYLGRGPKALNSDQKKLPNRQWDYLGEVPSVEEVPKTQEWGGETRGRRRPLRKKKCFSEAKLGKMVQDSTR